MDTEGIRRHSAIALALSLTLAPVFVALLGLVGCTATPDPTSVTKDSVTIPVRFRGSWSHLPPGSRPPGGEGPWLVTAQSIQGHESYGTVRSVTVQSEEAITVRQDVAAEGFEFTEVTYLKISADGSKLEMRGADGVSITLYRVSGDGGDGANSKGSTDS